MNENKSFFLVIEGMDGAGKSTIAEMLAHWFIMRLHTGGETFSTYEPNDYYAAGHFIRDVLTKRVEATNTVLTHAFTLNRADHLDNGIKPFLARPGERVVICDRYYMSSAVFQSRENVTIEEVLGYNADFLHPDLTIFLKVSPAEAVSRVGSRGKSPELFEQGFEEHARKYEDVVSLLIERGEAVVTVNANRSVDEVFETCVHVIKQRAPEWVRHLD